MIFTTALVIAALPFLVEAAPLTKRATRQNIFIDGDKTKCLGARAPVNANTPVESVNCDGSGGYLVDWDISPGNNLGVELSSTSFCLDSTTGTTNNTPLKLQLCNKTGLQQQTWYYTDDEHIAVTGTDQCVDLGSSGPQTYKCFGGNTNQIWAIADSTAVPTSLLPPTGTPTTTTTVPTATPPPGTQPTNPGQQIYFSGSSTGCLTTGHGAPGIGSIVYINGCEEDAQYDTSYYGKSQLWSLTRNVAGPIKLASNPTLCLDAGVNPNNNGSPVTIYTCLTNSDGSPIAQQNWFVTDDNHFALTGLTQCLDVVRDSIRGQSKPDGSLQDVSTWQCSGTDAQQIFTLL